MGDHDCVGSHAHSEPEQTAVSNPYTERMPDYPNSGRETISNPFALRPANSNNFQPAQPSPLQFKSPPQMPIPMPMPQPAPSPPPMSAPQPRQRAPTFGSSQSEQRVARPALPRINADVANKPFLAPAPNHELPISPAASSRSGSSLSNKPPPPLRSMTSPMPRLWDPRPPSPELSANLDCAFPPFPTPASNSRRPSTSSGRKTPNGSERAPSRSSSRQGHNLDPKSPLGYPPMNASRSITPESRSRLPSNDNKEQPLMPLDRRRPSSPGDLADDPPPLPPLSKIESYHAQRAPQPEINTEPEPKPNLFDTNEVPLLPSTSYDRKKPPERPMRPTDSLTPSLLDTLRTEPMSSIAAFPMPPLPQSPSRSNTFPLASSDQDASDDGASLTRMGSEPLSFGNELRPQLPEASHSEPSHVPQAFPARGASRNEARLDYRLQDAPPVPIPAQLSEANNFRGSSGSQSSNASSLNSLRMTNSSGASPVTSAASSMDAFSPLSQQVRSDSEDNNSLRVAGLSLRSQVKPGMRAEQPKEKSPPRNFARPAPLKDISAPFEESPVMPSGSWPLESPMDPAMKNGKLADDSEVPRSDNKASPDDAGLNLNFNLSPAAFMSDEYDPYRALTPQATLEAQPQDARDSDFYFNAYNPSPPSRSQTPKSAPPPQQRQGRPRSKTSESGRSFHPPPPPVPDEAPYGPPQMQLSRRPTIGGKSTCRGCGLLIEGKSIKAADGGLTGRWHKQCFVCKTCEQPFPNADFYVLNNQPYCEQHYHEKNRSLCFGCRKGIEGQYLETKTQDQRGLVMRKYHPKCFTCLTCRKTLTDDYFDFKGGVYCEAHAMASMRAIPRRGGGPGGSIMNRAGPPPGLSPLGNGGARAQRRTTSKGTTR